LSSAYQPIAGVLIPPRMYEAMQEESRQLGAFAHGFAYSGHPLAAAVALKTLEIYARDRIVEKAAAMIPRFRAGLDRLGEHPLVGDARGLGLVGAPNAGSIPRQAPRRIAQTPAQAEGLIVRDLIFDTVSLCPPVIISAEELDSLFERRGRALNRTLA
jgi:4-aminobutyrate---pyruvate transaminase